MKCLLSQVSLPLPRRWGWAWWLGWLLLDALLLCRTANAQDAVTLRADQGRYELGLSLAYLEDPNGEWGIDDVLSAAVALQFKASSSGRLNFGFKNSAYWLRFELHNLDAPSREWLLETGYPMLDHVDTHFVFPDGRRELHRNGDLVPFSARELKHRNPVVRVPLAPQERIQVFVRVQSESSLQIPLYLWRPDRLAAADHDAQIALGIYYGILLSMFLYNLLIYLSMRDVAYLYYVQYVFGWVLLQAALEGVAFEYLWPQWPWWGNRANIFFVFFTSIGISQFSRHFLNLQAHAPRLDQISKWLTVTSVVMMMCSLWMPYSVLVRVANGVALLQVLLVLSAGGLCLRSGVRQAKYFMLAWAVLFIGTTAFVLKQFGFLPSNFVSDHGLQIGSALEVVLLSLALAHRMRALKDENVRIQREAAECLEQRVQQRTMELNQALQDLNSATDQLKALNRTDALTGIHNRAYFNERLHGEWRGGMRLRQPLTLFILDLDFFKAVNDTHGHPGGDACLVAIARCLTQNVQRAGDVCFRYGGEEFAVLLPNTELEGAVRMANSLLVALRAVEIEHQGKRFSVTASIGVASVVPTADDNPEDLVGRADAALYVAKRQGRNQVAAEIVPKAGSGA